MTSLLEDILVIIGLAVLLAVVIIFLYVVNVLFLLAILEILYWATPLEKIDHNFVYLASMISTAISVSKWRD